MSRKDASDPAVAGLRRIKPSEREYWPCEQGLIKIMFVTRHRMLFYALGVFVFFALLYGLTAQRGVSWQDSGEFQYRLLAGDYAWNSGIARAHPLYIFLGRCFLMLFPVSMRLYACSLFSGLCMALALAALLSLVMELTRSVAAALTSVIILGFAHMAWWMSTVAEVYTLSLLCVMLELMLLNRFFRSGRFLWLTFLFAVNGLHFSVHNAALLALPVYGAVLLLHLARDMRKRLAPSAFAIFLWFLAAAMIWWRAAVSVGMGSRWPDVVASILFGDGYQSHVTGMSMFNRRLFLSNMALAAVSFLSPLWVFAPAGMVVGRSGNGPFRRALSGLTAIHFVFWIRYFVSDQATFVLPLLGLLAVWAGLGGCELRKRFSSGRSYAATVLIALLMNVTLLLLLPGIARARCGAMRRTRPLPGRNEWVYWLHPWKHNERSAADFVESLDTLLEGRDMLYADSTAAAPVMAFRAVSGNAGGYRLHTPWNPPVFSEAARAAEEKRFYVVSPVDGYAPEWLLEGDFTFKKHGVVFQVLKSE